MRKTPGDSPPEIRQTRGTSHGCLDLSQSVGQSQGWNDWEIKINIYWGINIFVFVRVNEVGNCCGYETTSQYHQKDETLQSKNRILAWITTYSLFSNVSEQKIFLQETAWNTLPPNLDLLSSFWNFSVCYEFTIEIITLLHYLQARYHLSYHGEFLPYLAELIQWIIPILFSYIYK